MGDDDVGELSGAGAGAPRARGTRVGCCLRVRVCWAFVLVLVLLACAGVGAVPLLRPLYEERPCLAAATLQAGEQVTCAPTRLDARVVVTVDRRAGMGAWRLAADRVPFAPHMRRTAHRGAAVVHGTHARAELALFLLRGSTLAADVAANRTVRVLVLTDAQHDAFLRAPAHPHPRAEAAFVGTAVTNFSYHVSGPSPGEQIHFVVCADVDGGVDGATRTATIARTETDAATSTGTKTDTDDATNTDPTSDDDMLSTPPAFVQWMLRVEHQVVDTARVGEGDACAFGDDCAACTFELGSRHALLAPRTLIVAGERDGAAEGVHVVQITLAYRRAVAVGATVGVGVALLLAAAVLACVCCVWDAEGVQRHRDRALARRLLARRVRFGRSTLGRVEPYDASSSDEKDEINSSLVSSQDPLLVASEEGCSAGTYGTTEYERSGALQDDEWSSSTIIN